MNLGNNVLKKPRDNGSRRVRFFTGSETLVEQSHKESTKIEVVLAKHNAHTLLAAQEASGGLYGNFIAGSDYQDFRERVQDAMSDFQMLPSALRNRFDNNPAKLIDFVNDVKNYDEAVSLGLVVKPEVVEPVKPAAKEPESKTE